MEDINESFIEKAWFERWLPPQAYYRYIKTNLRGSFPKIKLEGLQNTQRCWVGLIHLRLELIIRGPKTEQP